MLESRATAAGTPNRQDTKSERGASSSPRPTTGDDGGSPAAGPGEPGAGLFDDAPVVFTYSRAQAINDGVLIDVTETAREAGFKWPVALTQEAWSDCAEWTDDDTERSRSLGGQSTSGRLWDVLFMAFMAIKGNRGNHGDTLHYSISRIPRPGRGRERNVRLKLVVGPGDDLQPVVTIMMPHED